MSHSATPELSILVPAFNEAGSLPGLKAAIFEQLGLLKIENFEFIICDDGSADNTHALVSGWNKEDGRIKLISFSRNFGKEYALTALIAAAQGRALLMLDADGQHPVELIPQFVEAWREGAQVVIGTTKQTERTGLFKKLGSWAFHKLFNRYSEQGHPKGMTATDFRLIDREVQQAFLRLPETDRVTRGLLDWLGFKRSYIAFQVAPRQHGSNRYGNRALTKLAVNSFISSTQAPLYAFGYIGIFITVFSFLLGLTVFIEQLLLEDPLGWDFTGTAMLGILVLFMVGIVLMSQGILALYISHINNQSKQRPLYVVDYSKSAGIGRE